MYRKTLSCLFLWGGGGGSHNYRAIIVQNGVSHRCACVKLSTKGGVSHHFGGVLTSLKKYRAIWGYRSDSIAVSRDMGPLSPLFDLPEFVKG